ncbi:PREDICTED: hematopoietic prostaglandin D synthase-like [Branchiostoma belcheri]|uniref:glutathione transferase n=1 Tax=Branchiostoma belcheri TaxID=7741 RepID=A0A6P5ANY4_BRABE|nr:PREDICTED: hematopoietic prostaglandin D synthase-like [Branchiostoma belcheri]
MPSIKYTYFDGRGLGEVNRVILAAGGIKYEDVRLHESKWSGMKPTTPMGELPLLEVDGTTICQSNSIARYIAREAGLAGKSSLEQAKVDMIMEGARSLFDKAAQIFILPEAEKAVRKKKLEEKEAPELLEYLNKLASGKGYFVGDQLTAADIALYVNYESVGSLTIALPSLDKYPNLKKVADNVKTNPGIANWLKERPVTTY